MTKRVKAGAISGAVGCGLRLKLEGGEVGEVYILQWMSLVTDAPISFSVSLKSLNHTQPHCIDQYLNNSTFFSA